jgi:hypothetical protein
LIDYRRSQEARTDWYTSRIVAMVSAVNSRNHRYEPRRYMLKTNLQSQAQAATEEKAPMTGDAVFAAFQNMGHPMVDVTIQ